MLLEVLNRVSPQACYDAGVDISAHERLTPARHSLLNTCELVGVVGEIDEIRLGAR